MPSGSVDSRSRRSTGSVRSRRSEGSTKSRRRKPDDERSPAEPAKPDVHELRRVRGEYFGRAHDDGDKVVRPKLKPSNTTSSSSNRSSGHEKEKRAKRRHTIGETSKSKSTRKSSKDGDRTADYVYATAAAPVIVETIREVDSHQKRHSGTHALQEDVLATLDEDDEVTPEDSISQVAERTYKDRKHKRSNTVPTKLQPISEDAAPRKETKRSSGIFSSLFGRNNQPAPPPTAPRLVECLTCGTDTHTLRTVKLDCGHRMCHSCLKRVFEMSIRDQSHMPPTCCSTAHIPLKHVDRLFDVKFKKLWNRKYQEYQTKNRIYCPAKRCGEWIKPSHIYVKGGRKYACCPRCKTKVCTLCNNTMHRSKDCPKDPEIAALVAQAKDKGWQRCFACKALVELEEGCNHMTCRCTAEFCMLCGLKWKSCDCPWFNYSETANGDRLNEMRVPEPIQLLYRRVWEAPGRNEPPPARERRTYRDEVEDRRRQERLDSDLAHRLQMASLMDDGRPRRGGEEEVWGVGNGSGNHMGSDYVPLRANITMSTFGDARMGQRGERTSGRRRRSRNAGAGDGGLVPNFLGDESVLGAPAGRRMRY